MIPAPSLTVGIEEEYLLVDLETRALASTVPPDLVEDCRQDLGERVVPEFLQCQIEVATGVCTTMREARDELVELRSCIADHAAHYDLGLIAASTHPFSSHLDLHRTEKERYATLADDLQEVARRLVICGMHVHVAVEDRDMRMDLMAQATYVLPHLLALTTSSPFWEGINTGLQSYRLAVWDEMPRTGLPPAFSSYADYQRHVDVMVNPGLIQDATMLWWDLRPSSRFPTLEMRICDVSTLVDDAVAVAAIYRCWLHFLWDLRRKNQRWRSYLPMLLNENRWLAQRYGIDAQLADFGRGELVPYDQLLGEVLELIGPSAEALDCQAEVAHARTILERGTSAQRQLQAYRRALDDGCSEQQALQAVVDHLIQESVLAD